MKTIHLLRHAKSSWGDASLDDVDRLLNARGIRTAKSMADALVKAGCTFNHVFCSPAVRAQSTITLISEQLPEANIQWQTDTALYTFESSALLQWLQGRNEAISELMIVGHNPALTLLANQLSDGEIDHLPTCAYVQLTTTAPCTWSDIANTLFEVKALLKPKALGIN